MQFIVNYQLNFRFKTMQLIVDLQDHDGKSHKIMQIELHNQVHYLILLYKFKLKI